MIPAKRGSTAQVILDSGNDFLSATATGSVQTQSPNADKREIRMFKGALGDERISSGRASKGTAREQDGSFAQSRR